MQRLRAARSLAAAAAGAPAAAAGAAHAHARGASGAAGAGAAPGAPAAPRRWLAAAALAGAGAAAAAAAGWGRAPGAPAAAACAAAPRERVFTREQVAAHRTRDSLWVTYRGGVYDVTAWVALHPGGAERLMLAAGGAVDPFWAAYPQHASPEVLKILEGYRIGALAGGAPAADPAKDPYADEPADRHPSLVVRSPRPMNAETPLPVLAAALVTPTELFYVRNHLPVPRLDAAAFRLSVGGVGLRELSLSLDDLRRDFVKHEVTATLQCAGNRRSELSAVREVRGLAWEGGAVGTAVWGGALLRDVLLAAGMPADGHPGAAHVHFEGADADPSGGGAYGASIPAAAALDPRADVLLAWEMNGAPLSRDHGAPLRVVVPGVAGCRSVKWVTRVAAAADESPSFWQRRDYKTFAPGVDWDSVDWESAPAMQQLPVTSLVCEPAAGARVDAAGGAVTARGYAWAGGGRAVARVDVSADGGRTWEAARLRRVPQPPGRAWAAALWEAEVALPAGTVPGSGAAVELVVRAVDDACNAQPEAPAPIWNLRGVGCNSWHRVTVNV